MDPGRGRLPAQAGGPEVKLKKTMNVAIITDDNQVRTWTAVFASYL